MPGAIQQLPTRRNMALPQKLAIQGAVGRKMRFDNRLISRNIPLCPGDVSWLEEPDPACTIVTDPTQAAQAIRIGSSRSRSEIGHPPTPAHPTSARTQIAIRLGGELQGRRGRPTLPALPGLVCVPCSQPMRLLRVTPAPVPFNDSGQVHGSEGTTREGLAYPCR
jgi:hypothetical protein